MAPPISSLTQEQCGQMMLELETRWVSHDNATSITPANIFQRINENLGVTASVAAQQETVSRLLDQVSELYLQLDSLHALEVGSGYRVRIDKLMKVLGFSSLAVTSAHRVQQVVQADGDPADIQASFYSFRTMSRDEFDSDLRPYQKLLLHLTSQAQLRGYRRHEGGVYKARQVDGYNTYSWVLVSDIRKFVYDCCRKELFSLAWKWLTEKPNYAANAVAYLTDCEEYQFPRLERHRSCFSFTNGVYMAHANQFAPFGGNVHIDNNLCCAKFFELPFPAHHAALPDWRAIPTPAFSTITSSQQLPQDVADWLLVFLGRLLYYVGERDNWQVVPFVKGVANTGKSLVAGFIAGSFYENEDVGILSNNCERQFGLSGFYNKLIFCAPEIKADFKIEQAGEADLPSLPSLPP